MNKKRILSVCILLLSTFFSFAQQRETVVETHNYASLQIRTNLLYWAMATPNLGIEYKPSGNFGILVNGAFSHWIWSGEDNHHRTWLVQPEVRYYFGGRGVARNAPTGGVA